VQSLSWEAGQLSFEDEPLASAVARMNRYSRTQLVVGDDATAQLRVNGVFTAGDVETFVDGVTLLNPVEAAREPGQIMLRRR
jgi:transmembrane sensor